MVLSHDPGSLRKFRRTAWKFQQTFATPLQNLPAFVATIISAGRAVDSARLIVDHAAFPPKHLDALAARHKIAVRYGRDVVLKAENRQEVEESLLAALNDWIDFAFIPQPRSFVIYADHDEYATFYAQTRSNLNRITAALASGGFQVIEGYARRA